MSKNNIRKIKCSGNCLSNDESTLHPTHLNIITNIATTNKKFCPINDFGKDKDKECFNNQSLDNLVKNMRVPNLDIPMDDLLDFYEIKKIDSLLMWMNNNLENELFDTTNTILNLWIKNNLEQLKLFNGVLTNTIKKIIIYHFNDIDINNIDKE